MTITKGISTDQVRSLDLHQGDSLHVVAELGSRLVIQIVKATSPVQKFSTGKAGAWGRKYTGVGKVKAH